MQKHEDIELRSEEVQEILTSVPNWMIRWGNSVIFIIFIIFIIFTYIIKYPDIISTQIVVTTQFPPEKLVAKVSGKIDAIFVKDREKVAKNTPLAVLENAANYNDVFILKNIVDTINIETSVFPFENLKSLQLGEIENSFAQFYKDYKSNELHKSLKPFNVTSSAQSFELKQIDDRLHLLENQKEIAQAELKIIFADVERYESLYKKGIISTQEIEKHRLEYLQHQKSYKNLLNSISQLKSSINELDKTYKTNQINEFRTVSDLDRNVFQSFLQLKKAIKEWELNYLFFSSIEGTVSFMKIWAPNQTISSGENMFAIIPSNEQHYIGKVIAATINSGKLKVGQKVAIRLANYPDNEYGIIEGRLQSISLTPDKDNNLLLDVSLPKGLETSYNKKIPFQQEMSGKADIITEDLRIIERLLHQFRTIFDR